MNMSEFRDSRWMAAAQDPLVRHRIVEELPVWIEKLRHSELPDKARRLWHYMTSGAPSRADIIIAVAALLYLISPIDAVPDFIPFAGWLDDVTIAGLVLGYLDRKASASERKMSDL